GVAGEQLKQEGKHWDWETTTVRRRRGVAAAFRWRTRDSALRRPQGAPHVAAPARQPAPTQPTQGDAMCRATVPRLAAAAGLADAALAGRADSAIALELYVPVPAHRAAWHGDGRVLVATALRDHDVPVAFDTAGNRYLLSPDAPPEIPVLALVPVETDFS